MNVTPHHNCSCKWPIIALIVSFWILGSLQSARSAELKLVATKAAEKTILAVVVDEVDLLAGMKIVIGFDGKKYGVGEMKKSSATQNFIDLVNDKQTDKAIIVMASAKGTSGKGLELFRLEMKNLVEAPGSSNNFKILHCEMMDEKLKVIPCQYP